MTTDKNKNRIPIWYTIIVVAIVAVNAISYVNNNNNNNDNNNDNNDNNHGSCLIRGILRPWLDTAGHRIGGGDPVPAYTRGNPQVREHTP